MTRICMDFERPGKKQTWRELERERIERQEVIIEEEIQVEASQWSSGTRREEEERHNGKIVIGTFCILDTWLHSAFQQSSMHCESHATSLLMCLYRS